MNDDGEQASEFQKIALLGVIVAISSWLFGFSVRIATMRASAISRGHMEHDAKTDQVKWIEQEARSE